MPWQNVDPLIRNAGARARTTTAPPRDSINAIPEIDTDTLAKIHKHTDHDDIKILVHINSAAAWTATAKHKANSTITAKCPHCSHPEQNWAHTLQCPGLAPQLRHLLPLPPDFDLDRLPANVRLAVPEPIVPHTNRTFWGQSECDFAELTDQAKASLGIREYVGSKFATGAFTDLLISRCTANEWDPKDSNAGTPSFEMPGKLLQPCAMLNSSEKLSTHLTTTYKLQERFNKVCRRRSPMFTQTEDCSTQRTVHGNWAHSQHGTRTDSTMRPPSATLNYLMPGYCAVATEWN